ncbi:proline dehydrogenase [Spirosoma endbachense]|uniref:Proline dehydrogenase n=2 Tax=Spirosoma endbachense TaxID=2666025 RepID=A0A6P1VRL9_9BACT|nr:proline dehydrogenase [Spirosoma endbachense]
MNLQAKIYFDDTEQAFIYKSNAQLKKTYRLFQLMNQSWLVKVGTRLTLLAVNWKLPINGLLRSTIFEQFVGGETLEQTSVIVNDLKKYGISLILDYGAEGKESEKDFEEAKNEFIRVINHASSLDNINFISIKLTALARFSLLEKLNQFSASSAAGFSIDTKQLNPEEEQEWANVVRRVEEICELAIEKKVGILIDAEESWIQYTIDALTMQVMERYNKKKAIIYNTIQLYRHDRLEFLKYSHQIALKNKFILGAKIVRGAYMEKERKRANALNDSSPIQRDKSASDQDFNAAISYSIQHIDTISVIIASHNEYSAQFAVRLLDEANLAVNHPHIHFSQLYGMSDNITFNLAKIGCNVSKYLPYGPIDDVIPYLMRRAQENSSVAGQTSRELFLIEKEIKRRGI